MRKLLVSTVCMVLVISGCSLKMPRLPRVHKLTVQQGNVITQVMIDKLKPGMTRSQVAFIMGEPVTRNSFNDNRWDYVYTIELPGVFTNRQTVSLYFVDDVLAYFTGDVPPTEALAEVDEEAVQDAATDSTDSVAAESPPTDSD